VIVRPWERKRSSGLKTLWHGTATSSSSIVSAFEVHKGEILVILGASGCGKTTLLRHMVGLNRPISGRVFIDGDDITACDDNQLQKILKKVGILFQGSALIGSMTAAENVALPIDEYLDFSKRARDNLVRIKTLCCQSFPDSKIFYRPNSAAE